jgi:hypothetical protein
MSDGTLGFVALIAMLAVNRLVLSLAGYGTWKLVFWAIQFLNLAAACALVVWGLPGLPPGLWIVNWFIALLFMWHIVENNAKRVKHIRERQSDAEGPVDADEEARRQALRDKLRARGDDRAQP